jgi:hypothetical protein
MTKVNPQKLLSDLKEKATQRKKKTLDFIYTILEKQAQKETMDFSIATIGRLSAKEGGPSTQAIRNQGGADYRTLIEAYAVSKKTTTKKPLSKGNRNITPTRDDNFLQKIEDPALRVVFGEIIRERNLFRSQLKVLKSQTEFVIDKRKYKRELKKIEVLPQSFARGLNEVEQEALEDAISEQLFQKQGWQPFENGRIKDKDARHLYKPGYITAIKKILMEIAD